jgi:hypothetical protein
MRDEAIETDGEIALCSFAREGAEELPVNGVDPGAEGPFQRRWQESYLNPARGRGTARLLLRASSRSDAKEKGRGEQRS